MKRLLPFLLLLSLVPRTTFGEEVRIHFGYTEDPSDDPTSESGVLWNKVRTWGPIHRNRFQSVDGSPVALTLETTKRFSFHFNTGVEQSDLAYPATVSRHGYYLARKEKIGDLGPFHEAQVILGELNPDHEYKITFYGARMAGFHGDISLYITAKGTTEEAVSLHLPSGGAMEEEEAIQRIRPDSDGLLTLRFDVLEGYNRGVINSMIIEDLTASKP